MSESVATRIETAKAELSKLTKEMESLQKSKRDQTLITAAARSANTTTLAPLRLPPSTKLRRTLKGHFGKVTAMHWSTDSQRLVSASQDGNLLLWNALTTNKIQSIPLKSSYVMSVGMEPTQGQLVACGGLDNLCTIYKCNTSSPTVSTPLVEMASHDGFLSCCRFFNEQHIVTSSGDSTCLRWDIPTGKVLETFADHKADVMFLAIPTHTTTTFVSASVDRTVKLWDVRSPQACVQSYSGFHTGDVNGVDWMPNSDGKVFCSCSEDQTIRVYDIRAYNVIATYGGKGGAATAGDNVDSSGSGGGANAASGSTEMTSGGNNNNNNDASNASSSLGGYTSVSFSKSGRLIFCGHVDGSVLAFDTLASSTTTPAFTLSEAHEQVVSCLGVSPNGDALCTGSWDNTLKIWA